MLKVEGEDVYYGVTGSCGSQRSLKDLSNGERKLVNRLTTCELNYMNRVVTIISPLVLNFKAVFLLNRRSSDGVVARLLAHC
jgi:hypothetical protein